MRTSIKEWAISCLGNGFYPEHVVEKFLSNPEHSRKRNWVKELNKSQVLNRYICCSDAKFYGYSEKTEKSKRRYYRACGVTFKKMQDFSYLNYLLLLDVYENTTEEPLKNYYKAFVCLKGGDRISCVVMERKKMYEIVHKLQAKLINAFLAEPPQKEVLRNFLIISVLFSSADLLHDEATKDGFLQLCQQAAQ